ncbi:MAG: ABC transporter transmembrane domain-containing protein [Bacteroidota bacterium]
MADQLPTLKEEVAKKRVSREQLKEALKIFEFVRPYRWLLFWGLILLFVSSMVFMIFPWLAGQMLDIAQGNSKFDLSLGRVGWILLVVLAAQGFVSYARVMLFAHASERGIADVRKAVYDKIISLPIVFFEKSRVGELISRLTADVEQLYGAFSIILAEFIRQIIILASGIVILAFTTPRLAAVMLATFPIIVIGAFIFGRFIRRLSKLRQEELAKTNVILSESLQAITAVKSFTNEWYETRRYGQTINNVVKVALRFAQGRAYFAVFIVSVLFGALFFIIWQGALMVQDGTMTAGDLVAFISYTAIIGAAIGGLGSFYTQLLSAVGATERIREILNTESEVNMLGNATLRPMDIEGTIEYRDVQFSYPTRDDVPVLKGINLRINAGQKVALVGASGAGKSTIVQLLQRFYNIDGGDILVDGKNIFDYNITSYRRNLAIVPQEVILFGGTIRENILYGKPNATDTEIMAAARQSNSLEFIESFPEGLETIVGERGIKLSGGQRQRIAIARAILANPSILLLDEATSSLDAESEKVVQEALNTLMEGRTTIIIAHRLATVREVDCIYVIHDGKIIEKGTHDELSLIENGAYSNLARLQFETT